MPRLLFEKTGNAIWISHLDLMRLFQRAFKRAGLNLKHTQGFSPRPMVSIALPLSVGIESKCELLDFELEGEAVALPRVRDLLNQSLVEGIRVLDAYDNGRKIKELTYLSCKLHLEYDAGIPVNAQNNLEKLFAVETLLVEKKSKNGIQQQDIMSMIRSLEIYSENKTTLSIDALICCQNPSLNPMQIVAAITKYLPELQPDFTRFGRVEVYDSGKKVFR